MTDEAEAHEDEAIDAFNEVYDGYLAAYCRYNRQGQTDEEMDVASDELTQAIWAMVRVRAGIKWQVGKKLRALEALCEGDCIWADRRDRALLSSIRMDVEDL